MGFGRFVIAEDRISLRNLRIELDAHSLVHNVSMEIEAGDIVALVGASGSGKTLTARALLGMVDLHPGVVRADLEVHLAGQVFKPYEGVLRLGRRERDLAFRPLRGKALAYLPQDAVASLDPMASVRQAVAAAALLHPFAPSDDPLPALQRAGFEPSEAKRVANLYPHELSGGMAQRVAVAQTIARGSRFVVADEPTTGLDALIKRSVMAEFERLADSGVGILLITHDLRTLPDRTCAVHVMHEGRIVDTMDRSLTPSDPHSRAIVEATERVSLLVTP